MINPKLKAKNEAVSEDDGEEEVSKQVWPIKLFILFAFFEKKNL